MSFKKTEAIVIKAINFRDADKIITFFSRDYGKIQGIAKGIRKIRTKYSGKLDLFNRVNVIFFQKIENPQQNQPLLRITQVDVVEVFPQLKDDFNKIIGASYIAEFLHRVFEDHDASHAPVYALVCHALRTLAASQNIRVILPAFEVKLLAHLGYAPVLDHCTSCRKTRTHMLNRETRDQHSTPESLLGFNFSTGGMLCHRCKFLKKGTIEVTPESIDILQKLLDTEMREMADIPLLPKFHREIKVLLTGYIQYHLGIALKTDAFVQKLRSANLSNYSSS